MGSSKKHKKHRERDKDREKRSHEEETAAADQRPLKLVLKVGSTSTTVDRSPSLLTLAPIRDHEEEENLSEMSSIIKEESVEGNLEFGSSKKLKKKKSKKKHRKHSHHHHRHHHHRHKSSCHHSKSSSHTSKDHTVIEASGSSIVPMQVDAVSLDNVQIPLADTAMPFGNALAVETMSMDTATPEAPKSPLKIPLKSGSKGLYCNYLHLIVKRLQTRDSHKFFAWPVTDMIAPNYSLIIQRPMDFSTIYKKIDLMMYETVAELKADVKLMCDNAMLYNKPDTIYHKAAKKLWHYAREKVFSREALSEMGSSASTIKAEAMDGDQTAVYQASSDTSFTDNESSIFPSVADASVPGPVAATVVVDVEDDEERIAGKILKQAQAAAESAARRLSHARPQGTFFSFIRQRDDGSTSLGIVGAPPSCDRYLKLENLVGKLPEGTPYLPPYTEPESNKVKPIESVETTPFSSHLPSVDSSKSKLTSEETSLLMSTYGDEEVGIPYTKSLLEFASESDYLIRMADNLLNVLTQGQHVKVQEMLREEKKKDEDQETGEEVKGESAVVPASDEMSKKLHDTQVLLEDLERIQKNRLSKTSKPIAPAADEVELASTLVSKLTHIIGTATSPIDVTDIKSIRKAMGVSLKGD